MDDAQKNVGSGGTEFLGAAGEHDAITDKTLPQIYELVILQEGTITTLVDKDGNDLLPLLGGMQTDAASVKVPFTFKEGVYCSHILTGTAKVAIYKILQH